MAAPRGAFAPRAFRRPQQADGVRSGQMAEGTSTSGLAAHAPSSNLSGGSLYGRGRPAWPHVLYVRLYLAQGAGQRS